MTWRPIDEYPKEPWPAPVVLARGEDKSPVLVTWLPRREHQDGRVTAGGFYVCPGMPMWYGNHQMGFMTANSVTEFMEIPP